MRARRLAGKKIGIVAADGFEYVELIVPQKALRAAGATVEVLSLHRGRIRGMNVTEPTRTVRVDRTLDEADAGSYDALFIPGGFISPDFLRQSRRARTFVRAFDATNKPLATICHGPWLLISAELVDGRTLASWPGIRDDVVHAGGIWQDRPLVRDGNWVSSRGPQDLVQFVPGMIELFASGAAQVGRPPEAQGVVDVSSPQADEPAALAVAAARRLPGPAFRSVVAAAAIAAVGAYVLRRAA
jgi:protease I